jgi:hypothetical protein
MTRFAFGALSALAPLALLALASTAQGAGAQDEGPLPQLANDRSADVSEIDVSGAARALFKMAVLYMALIAYEQCDAKLKPVNKVISF